MPLGKHRQYRPRYRLLMQPAYGHPRYSANGLAATDTLAIRDSTLHLYCYEQDLFPLVAECGMPLLRHLSHKEPCHLCNTSKTVEEKIKRS